MALRSLRRGAVLAVLALGCSSGGSGDGDRGIEWLDGSVAGLVDAATAHEDARAPDTDPDGGDAGPSDAAFDAGAHDAAGDAGPDADPDAGLDAGDDAGTPWVQEPGDPTWFSFGVVSAQYSRTLDRLVLLTDEPSLVLVDPVSSSMQTVTLAAAGRSLSVSPDGEEALVGHMGSVTRVDLVTATVAGTFIAELPGPVVLDVNGIAHAGSHAYLSTPHAMRAIYRLDLTTGQITAGDALDQSAALVLHPDGSTLYVVLASGSGGAFDIRTGDAARLESFSSCARVFLTEDGSRLVNGCGSLFSVKTTPTHAMAYAGVLERMPALTDRIIAFDHMAATGRAAYVPVRSDFVQADEIVIAEDDYFTPRGLLSVMVAAGGTESDGRFVFFDASDKLTLVVRTRAEGLWGFVRVDLPPDTEVVDAPNEVPLTSGNGIEALGISVVDAEFSDELQRLVLAAQQPSELHLLDPDTLETQTIGLPLRPVAVALSPDQRTAVVGHLGWISIIDLTAPEVVDVLPLPVRLGTLGVSDDGHAYVFPEAFTEPGVYSVELSTGDVMRWPPDPPAGIFIPVGTRGAVHPDGDRLYGVGLPVGTTTDDTRLSRYDIGFGQVTATQLSAYRACGGLRFTEDGTRALTDCGRIFAAESDPSADMRYLGTLDPPDADWRIYGYAPLDHSSAAGLIASAPAQDSVSPLRPDIVFYADPYLTLHATRAIPGAIYDRTLVANDARFLFFSTDGTELHVITRARAPVVRGDGLYTLSVPSADPARTASPPDSTSSAGFDVLAYDVVAADYSMSRDRLVLVSDFPPRAHIYDPATGGETSIALPLAPTSVDVDPAGDHAAIGHDGFISIVDLASHSIDVQPITTAVTQIALSNLGWTYAAPQSSTRWLHALELATGSESIDVNSSSDGYSDLALAPDSSVLYGALFSTVRRFDVAAGAPTPLADWGSTQTCSGLFPTANGDYLVTSCGRVYTTSTGTLHGTFPVSELAHADHHATTGTLVAVRRIDSPGTGTIGTLYVFDAATLAQRAAIALPSFATSAGPYTAAGLYAFIAPAGDDAYVVARSVHPNATYNRDYDPDFAVIRVALPPP